MFTFLFESINHDFEECHCFVFGFGAFLLFWFLLFFVWLYQSFIWHQIKHTDIMKAHISQFISTEKKNI